MIRVVGGVGTFDAMGKSVGENGDGFVWLLFHGTEFGTSESNGYSVDIDLLHCSDEGFITIRVGVVFSGFEKNTSVGRFCKVYSEMMTFEDV